MKYKVNGTIELSVEVIVEADSEIEALSTANNQVNDGHGLGKPVGTFNLDGLVQIEENDEV